MIETTQRAKAGCALFYFRDSGGKHETTPGQYVLLGQRRARDVGVQLNCTPEQIERMIHDGVATDGDLYLDYCVTGNTLSRRGLDAMFERIRNDLSVSHVIFPRRDRFARPDDPLEGVRLEDSIRQLGVTVVTETDILRPIRKGQLRDIGEVVKSVIDYHTSGEYVRELSSKMIRSQIARARQGFAGGGRAPYGYSRYLLRNDGTVVQRLQDGQKMEMAGHHVRWLPDKEQEALVIKRIYDELENGDPAGVVAARLTADGIPSPDSGRRRKDNGTVHLTSGVWQQTTVLSIARNSINCGKFRYGRRSMGRLNRMTPEGPRELEDSDLRPDNQPKVILNAPDCVVEGQGQFQAIIKPERWERIMRMLDARSGKQGGRPRSRPNPVSPMGCRVHCMACTWTMYAMRYNKGFRHNCGLYQQSHGQRCEHNSVDGPLAVRFVLHEVQDRLLAPHVLDGLRARLKVMAKRELEQPKETSNLRALEAKRDLAEKNLQTATRNMTLAESDDERQAMTEVFRQLKAEKEDLQLQLAFRNSREAMVDVEAEVDAALRQIEHLNELADDLENRDALRRLFEIVNAHLFLEFEEGSWGKRPVRRLAGGVLTFGARAFPIQPYQGPTSWKVVARKPSPGAAGIGEGGSKTSPSSMTNGRKAASLRKIGRGGRI